MLKIYAECIRIKDWWNYIIPPILGFYLWGQYQAHAMFQPSLVQSAGFILLSFSVASFGFYLNEWTDIRDDLAAGKKNRVAGLSVSWRILLLLFILMQIAAGFYLSVYSLHAGLIFAFQILLLVLYSCPPFRLKKHLYLAPLFDALYSGTVFYLLAITVSYSTFFLLPLHQKAALCILFIWAMTRGFRNIILHFVADADFDQAIDQKTIGTHYELQKVRNFLKWGLLPVEIASFTLFAFVGRDECGILLGMAYLLFTVYWLNRKHYIIPYLLRRKNETVAGNIYDINMFHEVLLPLMLCLYLVVKIDPMYLIWLGFLLIAFSGIRKWVFHFFALPFTFLKR